MDRSLVGLVALLVVLGVILGIILGEFFRSRVGASGTLGRSTGYRLRRARSPLRLSMSGTRSARFTAQDYYDR
jgi:hypothetical protein